MRVANPIYDVVFKYLLEDSKIAKIFLSAIIGEEVLDVKLQPTEYSVGLERPPLTVYRIDFAARIRSEAGERLVLIELQKAKYAQDILRFRRYLGHHYANRENHANRENQSPDPVTGKLVPTPIITIYFLGETLSQVSAPVVKVNRDYIDLATGQRLAEREPFIESLTHDSYVIQIPRLKERRRTELEKLLLFFDQSRILTDRHILNIPEEEVPEQYHSLLRRLHRAIEDEKVRMAMDVEDDVLEELEDKDREIEKQQAEIEKQQAEIEKRQTELEAQRHRAENAEKRIKELEQKLRGEE